MLGDIKSVYGSVRGDKSSSGSVRADISSSGSVRGDKSSSGSVREDKSSSGSVRGDKSSYGSVGEIKVALENTSSEKYKGSELNKIGMSSCKSENEEMNRKTAVRLQLLDLTEPENI